MAGLGDLEKVKEEQLPPPPSNSADLIEDESNRDNNTAEVHHNEEAGLEVQPSDENDIALAQMMNPVTNIIQYELVGTASIETKELIKVDRVEGAWMMETAEEERGSSCARETKRIVLEYVDSGEEEIELDLDNFQTHAPHCPNCHHRITKLILRRKLPVPPPPPPNILIRYCITCFVLVRTTVSRFVVSIWRKLDVIIRPIDEPVVLTPPILDPSPTPTKRDESQQIQPTTQNSDEETRDDKHNGKDDEIPVTTTQVPNKPDNTESKVEPAIKPPLPIEQSVEQNENKQTDDDNKVELEREFIRIGHVNLVEMLKCIVYGGLIESITSSTLVASAAATDASTLNIFAIGLALLFSGLIAFVINLVELKNDVNTDKKYMEIVGGSKNKFVYHATLIILSYLVFGLVAPTTFALAFRESDDRNYKIVAAGVAAFVCILMLAAAKAYASQPKLHKFVIVWYVVKTTRHYVLLALFTWGVAYAVGYGIDMYVLRFGWFTSVERVTCYHPELVSGSAAPTY